MELLKKEKEVQAAYRTNYRIIVKFRDGLTESWVYSRLDHSIYNYILPSDLFNGKPIPLTYEYLFNPLDENVEQMKKLFKIYYKQWKAGHFWDQRMVIHKLIYRLKKEGWQTVEYHHTDLVKDLQELNRSNLKKRHFYDGILHIYGRYGRHTPGKMILEQYTNWENAIRPGYPTIKQAWSNSRVLYSTIKSLLRVRRDITRHNMLYRINSAIGVNAGHQFICPNTYRTIIKLCGLEGLTIADPSPGCGAKAIAATLAGCEYHSNNNFTELAKFLGTDFHILDREHYDCVILDNDFKRNDNVFDELKHWEVKADIKIIFVHTEQVAEMPKPDKYIKIQLIHTDQHYLFYYV